MKITILTLFPEMIAPFFTNSIIKRAVAKGLVEIELVNIRDFTIDKYGRVDTPPVGGGPGLVMKAQPIVDALDEHKTPTSVTYLLSPRGETFNQVKAHQLSKEQHLVLVCGHYEGVDERVNNYVDGSISLGDYVLTGGEIGAVAITDAVVRLLDGVIADESTIEESFETGLLEYPQYTEPYDFNDDTVPLILYSGNHAAIEKYRKGQALAYTRKYRPDLFEKYPLTKADQKLLDEIDSGVEPSWLTDAIAKGKKFTKKDFDEK